MPTKSVICILAGENQELPLVGIDRGGREVWSAPEAVALAQVDTPTDTVSFVITKGHRLSCLDVLSTFRDYALRCLKNLIGYIQGRAPDF